MSNNITKFLNSRNEVKLSSEKIELSMLTDVEKLSSDLESAWKKGGSVRASALREAKKKTDSEVKNMVSMRVSAWKLINEFEMKANEIGFDAKKTKSYQQAVKALSVMDIRIDELGKGFDMSIM